jgi:hypothetical protein
MKFKATIATPTTAINDAAIALFQMYVTKAVEKEPISFNSVQPKFGV